MNSGIYKIVNRINGKIYVGSAVNLKERFRQHKKGLRRGDHHNIHLQRAWNTYGEECFEFQIIELVPDKNNLIIKEQYWIDELKSCDFNIGYNIAPKAGSTLGVKWNEEDRAKQSIRITGRTHTEETKLKISNSQKGKKMNFTKEQLEAISNRAKAQVGENGPFYGKNHTEESKQKNRDAHLGTKLSEETRAKMSASRMGKVPSEETRKKLSEAKKVENLSKKTREKLRNANKGDNNPNAKLNYEKVLAIKKLLRDGFTQQIIADQFGVSRACVGNIKTGKIWGHVELE